MPKNKSIDDRLRLRAIQLLEDVDKAFESDDDCDDEIALGIIVSYLKDPLGGHAELLEQRRKVLADHGIIE